MKRRLPAPTIPTLSTTLPKMRAPAVNPYLLEYLLSDEIPERGGARGWWEAYQLSHPNQRQALRDIWESIRADVMQAWIPEYPGRRPYGWWLFTAPRWRGPYPEWCRGAERYVAELEEPRLRLGGTGTPCHECLNYAVAFVRGIPAEWVTAFDEEYYNGRALDIHGNRIGTEYHEGHFAGRAPRVDDPPRFESEAAYLDRHGMLTSAERRRLKADAFEPECLVSVQ